MKTLATIITGISLLFALAAATPVGEKLIVKDSEVHLKVALSYEGCEGDAAIYQINGSKLTKVADLEMMDKDHPSEGHSTNAGILSDVLADIDLNKYYIKSMESVKRQNCGFDMFYVLKKK